MHNKNIIAAAFILWKNRWGQSITPQQDVS